MFVWNMFYITFEMNAKCKRSLVIFYFYDMMKKNFLTSTLFLVCVSALFNWNKMESMCVESKAERWDWKRVCIGCSKGGFFERKATASILDPKTMFLVRTLTKNCLELVTFSKVGPLLDRICHFCWIVHKN